MALDPNGLRFLLAPVVPCEANETGDESAGGRHLKQIERVTGGDDIMLRENGLSGGLGQPFLEFGWVDVEEELYQVVVVYLRKYTF